MPDEQNRNLDELFGIADEPSTAQQKGSSTQDFNPTDTDGPEELLNEPLHKKPFALSGISTLVVGAAVLAVWGVTATSFRSPTPPAPVVKEPQVQEISAADPEALSKEEIAGRLAAKEQEQYIFTPKSLPQPKEKPVPGPNTAYSAPRRLSPPQRENRPLIQASVTKEDPTARWQTLAKVGSFGSAGVPSAPAVPVEPKAIEVGYRPQDEDTQISDRDEAPILTGRASRSLSVGATADGVVLSPVVYEQAVGSNLGQSGNSPDAGDVFLVRLEQPLKASDGSEALPVGTQMAVKVGSVSSNGFMRLTVASIAVDGQDTPIDPGTISVRGTGGYPLIAHSSVNRGAALASQDSSQALWSGVTTAASLVNRAQSQVVTTGLGGFSSSTTNPPPNVAAGFAEGAAGSLAQNSQQRSQRATQETLDRPNIWVVDPGARVQIVVNKLVGQL